MSTKVRFLTYNPKTILKSYFWCENATIFPYIRDLVCYSLHYIMLPKPIPVVVYRFHDIKFIINFFIYKYFFESNLEYSCFCLAHLIYIIRYDGTHSLLGLALVSLQSPTMSAQPSVRFAVCTSRGMVQ